MITDDITASSDALAQFIMSEKQSWLWAERVSGKHSFRVDKKNHTAYT